MLIGPVISIVILIAIFATLLAFAGTAFWIWMVIDCARNKSLQENQRIVWLLVIFLTHLLGALIYFFAGRTPVRRQYTFQPSAQGQVQYPSYERGYQPGQALSRTYQERGWQQDRREQPQYEQPQPSYPEIPQ